MIIPETNLCMRKTAHAVRAENESLYKQINWAILNAIDECFSVTGEQAKQWCIDVEEELLKAVPVLSIRSSVLHI